jgi:hypothetical protein
MLTLSIEVSIHYELKQRKKFNKSEVKVFEFITKQWMNW